MNGIKFLFVLFIFLQNNTLLYSQEISFYYDEIVGNYLLQLDNEHLLDSLTRQVWDESSSDWLNDSLYEHSYNSNNLADTIIAHKWRNGSVWGNDLRTRYIYNTVGNLILRSYAHWNSTDWNEFVKYQYTYGLNQNLYQMDYSSYYQNNWILYGYYIYSWNSNNYLSNVVHYTLSTIGPWVYLATGKDEYYYDSTNVLIMKTELWSFYGYVWINDINDLYFYDQNGNNNEKIRQDWNSTDSSWVNDYRYLYEYDINNVLLSVIYQDWQLDSLDWKNIWRETYTYTPQSQPATMIKETWIPETGWNNYVLRTYLYDANYNWTEKLTQLWDGSNWNNYYRHLATWLEPVSVGEILPDLLSYHLSNNYPNPFNPSTKIKFQIPVTSFVTLKVYDILGNEIAILVNEEKPIGSYEIEFNGDELTSGIYFYELQAGSFVETKKMILLK